MMIGDVVLNRVERSEVVVVYNVEFCKQLAIFEVARPQMV